MHLLIQRAMELPQRTLRWLQAWPWFAASIVLGFLIKENFPFSNWPMYSNFQPESGYVYIIDGAGEPIAAAKLFESAPRLRRQFDRERKAASLRVRENKQEKSSAEIEREAAAQLLKRLAQRLPPGEREAANGLGLVSVQLTMNEKRKITVSERTVAMIGFEGIPYTPPPKEGGLLKDAL
jgi:hypothetical protein